MPGNLGGGDFYSHCRSTIGKQQLRVGDAQTAEIVEQKAKVNDLRINQLCVELR